MTPGEIELALVQAAGGFGELEQRGGAGRGIDRAQIEEPDHELDAVPDPVRIVGWGLVARPLRGVSDEAAGLLHDPVRGLSGSERVVQFPQSVLRPVELARGKVLLGRLERLLSPGGLEPLRTRPSELFPESRQIPRELGRSIPTGSLTG